MNQRRGDLQDGWSAYEKKDYETAHRLIFSSFMALSFLKLRNAFGLFLTSIFLVFTAKT